MHYAIAYNGRGLAKFDKNARRGKVREMIGFSVKNYKRFETEKQAKECVLEIRESLRNETINLKLWLKVSDILDKSKIIQVSC